MNALADLHVSLTDFITLPTESDLVAFAGTWTNALAGHAKPDYCFKDRHNARGDRKFDG